MSNRNSSKEQKTEKILKALEKRFGTENRPERDPLDVLIRGILSQNTSDTNSQRAFDSLKKNYCAWDAVRTAPLSKLQTVIRSGGLARQKAETIQTILSWLKEEWARYDLDFLKNMSIEEAEKQLTGIKGIGIKTARLVLLFGFGRPAFVVDTHVLRVCKRTGLILANCSRIKAHRIMSDMIPPRQTYSAHMNMIKLGRRICRPKKPRCDICPLDDYCLHAILV